MPQLGLLGMNLGRPDGDLTEPGLLLGVGLRAPGAWSQRTCGGRAPRTGGRGGGTAGMPLLLRQAKTLGPGVTATLNSSAPLSHCPWGVQDVREVGADSWRRASEQVHERASKQARQQGSKRWQSRSCAAWRPSCDLDPLMT